MSNTADHAAHGDYAKGVLYEPDLEGKTPYIILTYFVVLTSIFFATVFALVVYFFWEQDNEMRAKIYEVPSQERIDLDSEEAKWLNNADKKHLDIETAMKETAVGLK